MERLTVTFEQFFKLDKKTKYLVYKINTLDSIILAERISDNAFMITSVAYRSYEEERLNDIFKNAIEMSDIEDAIARSIVCE